ncbi:MAG: ComF family protein [Clostridia bacterium]|nr:ComF family protein [Clostridia bacterium]
MKRLLHALEELLWPRGVQCLCCGELSDGKSLCEACAADLKAMRLKAAHAGNDAIRSVWRYDGCAKELILSLKLRCLGDAADVLADGMADAARAMALPPETVLTWVAMPIVRQRERGIDHGRMLCEAVAARLGLPAVQLLERTGKVHTQRGLSREKRLRNLQGTIRCMKAISTPVLLIDDVLTTGATASVCASELLKAGAPGVHVLTAARVMQHPSNNA